MELPHACAYATPNSGQYVMSTYPTHTMTSHSSALSHSPRENIVLRLTP